MQENLRTASGLWAASVYLPSELVVVASRWEAMPTAPTIGAPSLSVTFPVMVRVLLPPDDWAIAGIAKATRNTEQSSLVSFCFIITHGVSCY